MKILFLLLPIFLNAEITSTDLYSCNQGDYLKCEEIGSKYLSKNTSDYNPDRSRYPLKKSCIFGKLSESCYLLSKYYSLSNDFVSSKYYLKMSCDLGDAGSCYSYNSIRNY